MSFLHKLLCAFGMHDDRWWCWVHLDVHAPTANGTGRKREKYGLVMCRNCDRVLIDPFPDMAHETELDPGRPDS